MKFSEMVDQAVEFLRRRERVSYRALKREFDLDDESLEDLKAELIDAQQSSLSMKMAKYSWSALRQFRVPSLKFRVPQPLNS